MARVTAYEPVANPWKRPPSFREWVILERSNGYDTTLRLQECSSNYHPLWQCSDTAMLEGRDHFHYLYCLLLELSITHFTTTPNTVPHLLKQNTKARASPERGRGLAQNPIQAPTTKKQRRYDTNLVAQGNRSPQVVGPLHSNGGWLKKIQSSNPDF